MLVGQSVVDIALLSFTSPFFITSILFFRFVISILSKVINLFHPSEKSIQNKLLFTLKLTELQSTYLSLHIFSAFCLT